jgi:preprotein translocase subunit SecG
MSIRTALNLAQILISITLVVLLLLQAKGSGFGAALGGSSGSVFRTRRGVEKTLFQLTVFLVAVFVAISLFSVRVAR